MFVAKNLRLNVFRRVYLPKNREVFMRFGFRNSGDGYSSNGDKSESINMAMSKLDKIRMGEYYAKRGFADAQLEFENENNPAPKEQESATANEGESNT